MDARKEDIGHALAQRNQQFMDAWARGDAAAITALYTEEAQLKPPTLPLLTGREAVPETAVSWSKATIRSCGSAGAGSGCSIAISSAACPRAREA